MSRLYVLYEHAAGYALFTVSEFEEISMFLPQVESSVTDLSRFKSIVKLACFYPFKTAVSALENVNSISEGVAPQDLVIFLDDFFSKLKKKKCTLGVGDAKLGAAISESLQLQCNHFGVVPEILRGIRYHFHHLVKGFTEESAGIAQLGLGHSYSRAKVKFNVHRSDNMIIQSIALLDQLDKDINTFSMRIREWYSYHFPELAKIVPDNYLFAKCTKFIGDRTTLTEEKLEGLEKILMDSSKAQGIIEIAQMSMGMDISMVDLINIEMFAERVVKLAEYRQKLSQYLHSKMEFVAPNLQALIGDQVGARLISHAGSLTNLAKYPASTVQILGAEKALFRALKTKSNTPKYGLLYHSSYIGRAGLKNKGRISRFLANKCSIASRIDCFLETPTKIFGVSLKQQVEDRLKFYEAGEVPQKNIEVMKKAIEKVSLEASNKVHETSEFKKKKRKFLETENGKEREDVTLEKLEAQLLRNQSENNEPKKKKKQKKTDTVNGNGDVVKEFSNVQNSEEVKKKKKKKNTLNSNQVPTANENNSKEIQGVGESEENGSAKKKKKSKQAAD